MRSRAGIPQLRLTGKEKVPGGQENLRWVKFNGAVLDRHCSYVLSPFSFRKRQHLRLNFHVKQGHGRKRNSTLAVSQFHPILVVFMLIL